MCLHTAFISTLVVKVKRNIPAFKLPRYGGVGLLTSVENNAAALRCFQRELVTPPL